METTILDTLLGGNIPYITYAVPVFLLLMILEFVVAKLQGQSLYRFSDTLNNLSCGMIQQIAGMFTRFATVATYIYLANNFALMDIAALSVGGKWIAFFALLFGVDFLYYWFHRWSHGVNFLWAAHMVHHQSEEYNLAVALRQSTVQGWFSWAVYLPLAIVGFPFEWFAAMLSWNILYQFWVHTCTIDKMGPLEWVLNTPSHHRVHHGKNPQYIDRNHAGALIIWDRLFGTFEPEVEAVVYGTTRELRSWNPTWANFQEWQALWHEAKGYNRWQDKFLIWIKEPGWKPDDLPRQGAANPPLSVDNQVKFEVDIPRAVQLYSLIHFVFCLVSLIALMLLKSSMPMVIAGALAVWTVFSLTAVGGLLETKAWAKFAEPLRLLSGVLLLGFFMNGMAYVYPLMALVVAICLLSYFFIFYRRNNVKASVS